MPEKPVAQEDLLPWAPSSSGLEGFKFSWSSNVVAWTDIRYVVLDQHGGRQPLPGNLDVLAGLVDEELLEEERDSGVEYLIPHILAAVPGGLAIRATVSRVYCDLNRRSVRRKAHALDDRYFLNVVERYTSLEPEQAVRLYKKAKRYYDSFRGAWQTGPRVVWPSEQGLLERIHRELGPETLFWDLHTLNRYGTDGSQRALFQTFSRSAEGEGLGSDHEVIPRELCELVGGVVLADTTLAKLLRTQRKLGDLFRIDDPYVMYEGCTAEQISRHRTIIVTEVRKDLATDESGWGLEAARSVSVRILGRVLDWLQSTNRSRS